MITINGIDDTRTVGYLGNQLFMIANALSLSQKTGEEVVFPPFEFQNLFHTRPFKIVKKEEIVTLNSYQEPHFHFQEVPVKGDVNLSGYFQSWRYFKDLNMNDIFYPNESLVSKILETKNVQLDSMYLEIFKKYDIASIHVRRGDYVNLSPYHTNLPMSYYQEAIDILEEQTKVDFYLIFSDDLDWVKQNFKGSKFIFSETVKEKTQGNSSASFDLFLMSACRNNIIANSSFSWWGAYLNNYPNKTVIAPSGEKYKWFGPALNHDTKDLIPNGWICL